MTANAVLRILFVTARYLPSIGGVETHAHEIARRLAGDGDEVSVLTVKTDHSLPDREVLDGVKVMRVRAWPKRGDYYLSPGVYDVVRHADVDVVHCHGYYTLVAPVAMLAALRSHLPYVLTFHGRGHSSFLNRNLRVPQEFVLRPLLTRADRLIVLTERERAFYRRSLRLPESSFTIIPGGADIVRLDEIPHLEVDPDLIVSVGRAEKLKGHQRIIAALPSIASVRPGVKLLICGDGPYAGELQHQAERLGISDRVELRAIPFARRDELVRTLLRAALVVSLSSSEAQPLAALEAAYLKRPLLVTEASGLRDVVEAGLAAGVGPDASSASLAEIVIGHLRHPRQPPTTSLPTWDECAARLQAFYAEVLRTRRRRAERPGAVREP
jgi:glycosyltransferase involved in cell wall biosynthesis